MNLAITPQCARCGWNNPPEVQCCLVCSRRAGTPILHAHDHVEGHCTSESCIPCIAQAEELI
jgi:hypothetical protein